MNRKYTIAVLLILLTAAAIFATPVSENGQLHVQGLQLTNECGYPVQLRGTSTHGIMWYQSCYTASLMDFLANTMKSDFLRVAMYSYEGTNSYVINPSANTALVKTLVNMATARGMYAIIDWHILADKDPNTYKTNAAVFFTEMANTYKDNNNVIYEICNEPNGAAVTWAVVKTYADYIIPIIRAIDPDAVIICGTPNWSQLGSAVVADPLSYSNIMYAFHFYAGSHSIGMLTPYLNSLPIFCSEWGPSNSSGNGGDNYDNATAFLDIMNGADTVNNPSGVKISWAEWSLADNADSSSVFNTGTCGSGVFNLTKLSTAGNYIYDKINNPEKNFICGTATITPTNTPYAGTPTPTYTVTSTPTMLPWDLVYNGDTAGYTLADGVAVSNAWINTSATPVGTITELPGGNPGKGMYLNFVTPGWWEGHSWSPNTPKVIGSNSHIEFEILAVIGSAQQLRLVLDRDTKYAGLTAGTNWTTVRVPLSQLYTVMPAVITEIDFVCNYNNGYSVLVDNIRLVSVPTNTYTVTRTITPTITHTPTRTMTFTQTLSSTVSETFTITQTPTETGTPAGTATSTATATATVVIASTSKFVDVSDVISYPNPTTGGKVTFRYNITGLAKKLTVNVYTFGERKIYSVERLDVQPGMHTEEWIPSMKLANGLYYFTVEGVNGTRPVSRHVKAFFVHRTIPTP